MSQELDAHLPRSLLKNLRLTCKTLNERIVSPASPLFSRAYISTFRADLDVLELIVSHPQIAPCVRTLIWDTSIVEENTFRFTVWDAEGNVIPDHLPQYETGLCAYNKINREAREIREHALDFKVLLTALPRFPRLERVVITHAVYFRRCTGSLREPGAYSFISPAVREWARLGIEALQSQPRGPPDNSNMVVNRDDDPNAVMFHISQVAKAFSEASDKNQLEEVESSHPTLANSLGQLRIMHQRPMNMLAFALRNHDVKFKELHIVGAIQSNFCGTTLLGNRSLSIFCPPENMGQPFDIVDYQQPATPLSFFDRWNSILDGFTETLLCSLRHLCLTIDFGFSNGTCRKEALPKDEQASRNLLHALESATNLEVLELRSMKTSYANFPEYMLRNSENLFSAERLKMLVLDNFFIERQAFEQEILPWCFAKKLHTLHLRGCTIVGDVAVGSKEFLRHLIEKDVRFEPSSRSPMAGAASWCCGNDSDEAKASLPTNTDTWPYDSDDRTSFYSDDPDYDEQEYFYEYKDAPRTAFLDIDFGSEFSGSSHGDYTEYDARLFGFSDDEAYFPCPRALWDLYHNALIRPLFEVYWDLFHPRYVAAYDEEYMADTAGMDVLDEFPVPPLTLHTAWRICCVDEGFLDGRGTGEHTLRLNFQGFSYIPP